ncbi:hypothetical protein GCM10010976_18730 [Bizionia arctica]|uniref:DUF3999 family protein n=2 Tax=Bizionia arctica TaxID=1495645 RepID=A0A917LPI2_9FLAO|nr:hypothetical protein GCM10010976_18730 [Bizionia arctica]
MLLGSVTFAQTSLVTGTIDPVQEDGLYRIQMPQEMRSYATSDLRDIRIWADKGKQVPYFIQPTTDYINTRVSDFKEFSIVSSTRIADSSATYIFKNPYDTLEKAVFLIANYQGNKSYKLEGSNNQKQWFGIVNSGQLNQLSHSTETSVYKSIHFPLCRYQYLKVVFDDRKSLPINLLKIGMATTESVAVVPIIKEQIPVKSIEFLEKDKRTQIHIRFNRPQLIDQIRMQITSPELYSRNASFYTIKEREVKRSMESYRQNVASFSIRSDKDLVFNVPRSIEKEVYLEIDNKDNPKLQIKKLQFLQEAVYLVASLKSLETYKVTAGNDTLTFPDYDIFDVTNTTKSILPIAKISSVVYEQEAETTKESSSIWQQPWFMWCCIGIASLMILYVAFNLLKDLNKNKIDS